jgi:hypothetical protein
MALCLLHCSELPAFSRGSASTGDDPWNRHHIAELPAEVRQHIAGICKGAPIARHDFATYSPHEKRWRINLEYIFNASAWASIVEETNVWTLISLPRARIFT